MILYILREVGTIVRSLRCCPTEGELHDILAEVEEEEPTGYIRFEKFEPVMLKTLLERRYKPAPEDQIMKAFEVLDQENKGYLTTEELTKYMTEEGMQSVKMEVVVGTLRYAMPVISQIARVYTKFSCLGGEMELCT